MWGQYHPTYTPPWLYAMSCCCVNTNINISIKKKILARTRTQYTYQDARHEGLARTRGISRNNAEFAAESTRVKTILEARQSSLVTLEASLSDDVKT